MLKRYSREEFRKIWNDENKYKSWWLVEYFAIEAYAKYNKKITKKDLNNLWNNARINVKRIEEIENETKHDIIAFTRQISETLGQEKKWVHYGLTSTDVVDTAQSLILKNVNVLLLNDIKKIIKILKNMAIKYKETFQIGRTHGIHAEVTTFGYKLALWFDEMNRNLKRFQIAANQIEIAKISGAVGNYANVPLDIQEYVAKKLKLNSSKISTQTLQRDRHAEYIFTLSLIASTLDKMAIEIRHLQRTEVNEVNEGFSKNQKGSSAMPHKKNPISSENISGLARVMRGYVITAMENIALWHERDISHSSAERIILADATTTLDYMLNRFINILKNLVVKKENMKKNIQKTHGIIFSQRVMLKLIQEKKISREKAYDLIQPLTMQVNEKKSFTTLLIEKKILSKKDIQEITDLKYYTKNINKIFQRLNLIK